MSEPIRPSQYPQPTQQGLTQENLEKLLLIQFILELEASYKQQKRSEAASADTSTKEGRIKQVEAQVAAGEISVTMAINEIILITQESKTRDNQMLPEVPAAAAELKNMPIHILTFLSYLKALDNQSPSPLPQSSKFLKIAEQLLDSSQTGVGAQKVGKQLNELIGQVNLILPAEKHYPSLNLKLFS